MFILNRRSLIPVFFFIIVFSSAKSQSLEPGLAVGGCYYLGDLNPGKHFLNAQPSFGGLVRYNIDTRWAVKLAVMRGSVRGDASNGTPNLRQLPISFNTRITDISGVAEFNFLPYFTGSQRERISPYIYAGFSGFVYTVEEGGTVATATEFSFPFGVGAKFSLASRLGLQVYWEMHKTFTDKLDNVFGDMINGNVIGDPNTKDWFSFFGASLTYKFKLFSSNKCKDLNH